MKVRNFTVGVKFSSTWAWFVAGAALWPGASRAHVSEGGFVLLLPTGAYSLAGGIVVALTVLAVLFLPHGKPLFAGATVENKHAPRNPARTRWQTGTSLLCLALFAACLLIGLTGSRDPLSNLLPLAFWTLGWVGLVALCGLVGDLWPWLNPWTGLYRLLNMDPLWRYPVWLSHWPAVALLLGFSGFLLADVAPSDPARLARLLGIYWCLALLGTLAFGETWLDRAELGRALSRSFAALSPFADAGRGAFGGRLLRQAPPLALGIFALVLLGSGSFDGLNETFWWLARIGVNPLEFPGRSAVVVPTLSGLALANLALVCSFALAVAAGRWRVPSQAFVTCFAWLALSLLPIALAYHIAHYLTSFLIGIQYLAAALNDPLASGAALWTDRPLRVTTGFLNRMDTVRVIWLTQAGVVVLGHVWSVLLAHGIAQRLCRHPRHAGRLTFWLSIFMVIYTFLGLWLLAAPKGA